MIFDTPGYRDANASENNFQRLLERRNVETKDFKKQINERKSSFMKTDRGTLGHRT